MCAPENLSMEEPSLSRFDSRSTGRTLVGSDNGLISPLTEGDRKRPIVPFIQTGPDNKQWIDLDFISPKLLRELRRQYDPSLKDESRHSLAKDTAAKVKAWARQSKLGIDIRLRRKINAEHDEVTDIHLVPEPFAYQDEKSASISSPHVQVERLPLVSELSAHTEISELPDSSIIQELPTVSERTIPVSSVVIDDAEPLPVYEPRHDNALQPRRTNGPQVNVSLEGETAHQRSTSQSSIIPSSIVPTPTRGLSVHSPPEARPDREEMIVPSTSHPAETQEQDRMQGLQVDLAEANRKLEKEQHSRERFEGLLRDVQDELSKHRKGEDSPHSHTRFLRGLKVAESARYETETDVEPPSPSDRRAKPVVRAKKTPVITKRRKSTAAPKALPRLLSQKNTNGEHSGRSSSALIERQPTKPKLTPASAGIEGIWDALLTAQAKIIGPEHPLTYQAKSDLARSRASHHRHTRGEFLGALQESATLATNILGHVHPLVTAFLEDLDTLSRFTNSTPENRSDQVTSLNTNPSEKDPHVPQIVMPHDVALSLDTANSDAGVNVSQRGDGTSRLRLPPLITARHPSDASDERAAGPVDALWNTWQPPHKPRNGLSLLGEMFFDAAIKSTVSGLMWLQANYGPEQPVERGKVRVRWTCACGKQLHDDFVEKRQGAARELEAYLNRPRTHTGQSPVSPSSSQGTHSFGGGSSIGGPPSSQTTWSSYSFPTHTFSGPGGDTKSPGTFTTGLPFHVPFNPQPEPPWLLCCANEDRHTPKLAHLDMAPHRIRSDKDLALALRDHYFNVNKKWWRTLRLRSLATIDFVQFEVHQNRFADIRQCPDMPPSGSSDYSFEPGDLMPPVGSQYLLHLFKHPGDYDGELITYLRAPKKNGRLQLGVGWGINLVESFAAPRVWLMISSFFALGSLVFAVVWAWRRQDVQGAFGVAAWICTLAALVVGWLQATLG